MNNFLELYFEQKSIMRECRLRNPAAALCALAGCYIGKAEFKMRLSA